MGLLNIASGASLWRGYEYYRQQKVNDIQKESDVEYYAKVEGNNSKIYDVFINIEHPRKSHCNCPFAGGKRIVCKHQVALYFTILPEEAENYYKEVVEYEEELEREEEELYEWFVKYLNKMTKEEMKAELYTTLLEGPEWQFQRFVNEHKD